MRTPNKRCGCGKKATFAAVILASTSNVSPRAQANSRSIRLCDACLIQAGATLKRLRKGSAASRLLKASVDASDALQGKLTALARHRANVTEDATAA